MARGKGEIKILECRYFYELGKMTKKCTTDQVSVAVSATCSWAVHCLPAFPKLLNGQMILKSSHILIICCSEVSGGTQIQF